MRHQINTQSQSRRYTAFNILTKTQCMHTDKSLFYCITVAHSCCPHFARTHTLAFVALTSTSPKLPNNPDNPNDHLEAGVHFICRYGGARTVVRANGKFGTLGA